MGRTNAAGGAMVGTTELPEDDVLLALLRAGDEQGFGLVLDAWSAGLMRTARAFGCGAERANQLVRETWLAVVRDAATHDGGVALRTWVFHQLFDVARRNGELDGLVLTGQVEGPTVDPARFQGPGGPYEGHWKEFPEPWPPAEDPATAAEIRGHVATAVAKLPVEQRIVVSLRDVERFDASAVASILRIAEADQLWLLHHARAFVRAELEAHFAGTRTDPEKPAESPADVDRRLRRRLLPLYVAAGLSGIGLWVPIEKLFMNEIGFTAATVGVMAAAYAALTPAVEIPSGILADRWSRRGVLVIASSALAVSALIGGLSTNVGVYIVSALVLGVYFAMYSGTMESVVYDTVLEETGDSTAFQQKLGRVRLVESAALVGSSLLGGWLAGVTSTRLTYFLTVPFAAASIVLYLMFREPRLHKATESTSLRAQIAVTYKTLMRRGLVLPIVVVAILTSLILQVMFEFGPLWLVALSAAAVWYGPFWAGLVSTLGLGGLLAGKLRLDRMLPLAVVIALMLLAGGLLVTTRNLLLVALAQIILALLVVVASIYVTNLLHDAVPSSIRTGVASGVGALSWIAFLPFALVFGVLSDAHGVDSAAWMIVGLIVVAGFTLVRLALRPRPHSGIVALVPGHLDGTLGPFEEQRVADHLAACGGCRTYVEQLRRTIDVLGDLPAEALPNEERDAMLATLRSRTSRVPIRPGETQEATGERRARREDDA